MFREIKKKQVILDNRKPYSNEINSRIQDINRVDWIFCSLRLDGSALTRGEVEIIINGGFIESANLNEHTLIEKYCGLFKTAENNLALSSSLNKEMILSFQRELSGAPSAVYRKDNPVLVSFGYTPPHPAEIEEQMDILMNWYYSEDEEMERDPILKAVCLHNRIIEVYPFGEYSEATARAAMYYYLMEKGYPAFEINMSKQEYESAVAEYLKKENTAPFRAAVERGIYNKMEVLMQLTELI